jgi:hypothetical protein
VRSRPLADMPCSSNGKSSRRVPRREDARRFKTAPGRCLPALQVVAWLRYRRSGRLGARGGAVLSCAAKEVPMAKVAFVPPKVAVSTKGGAVSGGGQAAGGRKAGAKKSKGGKS